MKYKSEGPMPVESACDAIRQAAEGLEHAHQRGMVHRDIKPQNLMRTSEGQIKILDFGLARLVSEVLPDLAAAADEDDQQLVRSMTPAGGMKLTLTDMVLGSADYIAPEQALDPRSADIRADIYSLGCTLYHLLAGQPPFPEGSLMQKLAAHAEGVPQPLSDLCPDAPSELTQIVYRMMAKEPKRRFHEPKEVAQALAPFSKTANAPFKSSEEELSDACQSGPVRLVPRAASPLAQPVTTDAGPTAQQKRVAKTLPPESEWKSPIDRQETERARDEIPAIAPTWRPHWLWLAAAGGVSLLVLCVACALVARGKASKGVSDQVNVPDRPASSAAANASVSSSAVRVGNGLARAQVNDLTGPLDRRASVLSGSWRIEGKELVQNGGEGTILLGDTSLSSFDIKFQGQVISGNEGFMALFHCTADDNFRYFRVGGAGGKRADSGFRHEGEEGGQFKQASLAKGRWYNVTVKVRGVEFWCYFEGQELFHDLDNRWERGRIGLATWDADARYRDIVISTPEGRVLWKGPPDLPAKVAEKHTSAPVRKVSVPPTRAVYVNEFDGPQTGSPRETTTPHNNDHGRSDGVFFFYAAAGLWFFEHAPIHSDGTCEVVGRVSSQNAGKTAAWAVKVSGGYALRLMAAVKDVSELPTAGKNLVIVAAVGNVLHFRMFDGDGKLVVDTDEKEQTAQVGQIEDLRRRLGGLWPPHQITGNETGRVIAAVTSIARHDLSGKLAGRGFVIKINVKGELSLEPNPWSTAEAFRQIDPMIGPIIHPAIKPGNEWNKLLLLMTKREVTIFVNDVQVCAREV